MPKITLQIQSEEIPASMLEPAAKYFAESLDVDKYRYSPRFFVIEGDLPEKQEDEDIEKRGPKIGAPEQALNGFARSCGVEIADLEERDGYYYFTKQSKGELTKDYLAKKIPEVLAAYTWPKSMRWGEHEIRWARPLHAVECEFGGELVEFKFGHIDSSPITNHPSLIIDHNERKELIIAGAKALHAGVELDEKLLDEVNNLVETPVVMMGEFSEDFLTVPAECLVVSMKSHQKYFPIYEDGKLANKFIFVANLNAEDGGKKIVAGNEKVLHARLSDAKFFWDQDRKQSLQDLLPKLKLVTFHNKIGNMYEKAERIADLSEKLAPKIGADTAKAKQAGLLAKADLVSEMVGEFASLQGIMGGYYADDEEIGEAIKQHYSEPSEPLAICLALADRIDSLTQLWAAGEKPTGSRDPFGLRRAALGIIRIILENNLRLNLKDFVDDEVFAFMAERLKHLLKAKNIRHDVVDAVLGQGDDLFSISSKASALAAFLDTDSGALILAAYNRAVNILVAEEKKDGNKFAPNPDESLLESEEEKSLFSAITDSEIIINQALETEDYELAMQEIAKLQPVVDAFFENVIVNVEAPKTRQNRLKILAKIRDFMQQIADFSCLEG